MEKRKRGHYERSKDSLLLTRGREYDNHNGTHDDDAQFFGIIAIGGDGTIAEVYAGLEQKELRDTKVFRSVLFPLVRGTPFPFSGRTEQRGERRHDDGVAHNKGQTIRLDGARLEIYRNDENSNNDTTNHATKSNGNGGKEEVSLVKEKRQ